MEKFRIWNNNSNGYLKDKNPVDFLKYDYDNECYEITNDFFNNIKIEQGTNFFDKNGKEMFVGDIIDIHETVNGQNLFVVVKDELGIYIRYAKIKRVYEYNILDLLDVGLQDKKVEVVGNINENKELLENDNINDTKLYR